MDTSSPLYDPSEDPSVQAAYGNGSPTTGAPNASGSGFLSGLNLNNILNTGLTAYQTATGRAPKPKAPAAPAATNNKLLLYGGAAVVLILVLVLVLSRRR